MGAIDGSQDVAGNFCDLLKAFNGSACVPDHAAQILKYYSIKGNAFDLLESYLMGRKQEVKLKS